MWQRQQQVGSHMTCAPFVNLALNEKVESEANKSAEQRSKSSPNWTANDPYKTRIRRKQHLWK